MRFPHVKSYDKLDEKTKQRIKDEDLKTHISNVKGAYIHRKTGLCKKTITVKLNDSLQHMVIYEDKEGMIHLLNTIFFFCYFFMYIDSLILFVINFLIFLFNEGTHDLLHPPRAYVELLNIEVGIDLSQNEALRRNKDVTPKLNKINEVDISSRNECDETVVKHRRPSSNSTNIPPIRSVPSTQTLPSIAEALYSPAPTLRRTPKVEVPDTNHIPSFSNLLSDSQENSDSESIQTANCLVANGINICQNNGYLLPPCTFPAYTYRTAVVMKDTVIPDMVKADPMDSDYFGLVDFSRL